jgi:site-specific DNA-cytosine methylase
MITVVDLFCGAGGFSEGFKRAGFRIQLGLDNDFLATETFRLNHGCDVWKQDILEVLTLPPADVIIGSPPCPQFSVTNRNFKDEPDTRYMEKFFSLVDQMKPRYWVMENVGGIEDYLPENRKLHTLYLQANWFGLNHKRERIFVTNFDLLGVKYINPNGDPIFYPTPVADDRIHKSKNHPQNNCLSDYFGFVPEPDVFKKVMGFPPNYVFIGKKADQIQQIGNAVCPPVAHAIAMRIKELEEHT